MRNRIATAFLGSLIALFQTGFSKTLQGVVYDRTGHAVISGEVRIVVDCIPLCSISEPRYRATLALESDGSYKFDAIPSLAAQVVDFKLTNSQGEFDCDSKISILSSRNQNFQIDGFELSQVNLPTVAELNQKILSSFPDGNLLLNSSFESESFLYKSGAIRGWIGYGGAAINRIEASTYSLSSDAADPFGKFALYIKANDNTSSSTQGAEYVITQEDPAFKAIQQANADGKALTISAWVRTASGTLGGIGRTIVFGNINSQGNDGAYTFVDEQWHKISYTFTSTALDPDNFLVNRFGFSIHEKEHTSNTFTFLVDNVVLTSGDEQSPAMASIDLSDGEAKLLQSEVVHENKTSQIPSRVVVKRDYDPLGRPSRTWLPVEESCSGVDCMRLTMADPNSYYNGTGGVPDAQGFAFSQPIYENDPLARTFQASLPGSLYQPNQGHLSKLAYSGTNDLLESSLGSNRAEPANTAGAVYSYTHQRDENGHESMVWKDQLGNVAKTSSYEPGQQAFISSRAVYDDKGRLIMKLPPISCKGPDGTATPSDNCVEPTVFAYNQGGQLVSEKSPDAGETKFVYNVAGLLRAKQTQTQTDKEFTIYKYDELGRLTETGLYSGSLSQIGNAGFIDNVIVGSGLQNTPSKWMFTLLPTAYNAAKLAVSQVSRTSPLNIYQITVQPDEVISPEDGSEFTRLTDANGNTTDIEMIGLEHDSQQSQDLIAARQGGGNGQGVEDRNWPYAGSYQVLVRNIYDDVANLPSDVAVSGTPYIIPAGEDAGFSKGRLVASINYNPHLALMWPDAKDRIVSTFYKYDTRGNKLSEFKYIGTVDKVVNRLQEIDFAYDESDRLVGKTVWKNSSGSSCQDMSSFTRFTYDEEGRLSKVFANDKSDCTKETQIASYLYDPDGRVGQLALGNPSDRILVDYFYHIRGWLNNITARQISCSPTGVCNPTTIYSEDLKYDGGMTLGSAQPQFNGNISEILYYLGQKQEHRSFDYDYDGLNRMIKAHFSSDKSGVVSLEEADTYLADGRLKNMVRSGANVTQTQTQPYKYYNASNRLKCVDDVIDGDPLLAKDRTCAGADHATPRYSYDASGNRTNSDDVASIDYDWRNLPWRFSNSQVQYIMVYDADGNRVSKVDIQPFDGNTVVRLKGKHYVEGEKEILEFADESKNGEVANLKGLGLIGRINLTGDKEFYIKNHQGNLITEFSDGGDWASKPLYDYFPYGKQVHLTADSRQPITETFTGKELDDEIGLYYFGARYYDANLGLWMSPDPKRQFHSPYSYGPGNPPNGTDDIGRIWETIPNRNEHGNVIANIIFNVLAVISMEDAPHEEGGFEVTAHEGYGVLNEEGMQNLTTRTVTQRWVSDPEDPSSDDAHPLGLLRIVHQTMESQEEATEPIHEMDAKENGTSLIPLPEGEETKMWGPYLPDLTYLEGGKYGEEYIPAPDGPPCPDDQ